MNNRFDYPKLLYPPTRFFLPQDRLRDSIFSFGRNQLFDIIEFKQWAWRSWVTVAFFIPT